MGFTTFKVKNVVKSWDETVVFNCHCRLECGEDDEKLNYKGGLGQDFEEMLGVDLSLRG